MRPSFPGAISLFLKKYLNKEIKDFQLAVEIAYNLFEKDDFIFLVLIHEFFHFLFENNLTTDRFPMIKDHNEESEFNSLIKELMFQMLQQNKEKFFKDEEVLKNKYFNFEDKYETKYLLKKIEKDETILKTLMKFNIELLETESLSLDKLRLGFKICKNFKKSQALNTQNIKIY